MLRLLYRPVQHQQHWRRCCTSPVISICHSLLPSLMNKTPSVQSAIYDWKLSSDLEVLMPAASDSVINRPSARWQSSFGEANRTTSKRKMRSSDHRTLHLWLCLKIKSIKIMSTFGDKGMLWQSDWKQVWFMWNELPLWLNSEFNTPSSSSPFCGSIKHFNIGETPPHLKKVKIWFNVLLPGWNSSTPYSLQYS